MSQSSIRAAQYVRMSTEHQNYSIESQTKAIAEYARLQGITLVRSYVDPGRSGLTLRGRPGLQALLADVAGGDADYTAILVYDVSRWGRFQDPDESAHYEFICRSAGVQVVYCAEIFAQDRSLVGAVVKSLKRVMAAEFSRELSVKVAHAQRGLAEQGYWQGGPCGYGLRRAAVTSAGEVRITLEPGEQKSIRGDRSRLVLGPDAEVETVRRIFRLFVVAGMKLYDIAVLLNAEGVRAEAGATWTEGRVRSVLRNRRYVGVLVHGRMTHRLHLVSRTPKGQWVVRAGACPVVVSQAIFDAAQLNLIKHKPKASDEVLIAELHGVMAREGRLSRALIRDDPACHALCVYVTRFGSLLGAYKAAGYSPSARQLLGARIVAANRDKWRRPLAEPPSDAVLISELRQVLATHGQLTHDLIRHASGARHPQYYRRRFGGMRRAYALAGYAPTEQQDRVMSDRGGQTITTAEADLVRGSGSAPLG